MCFSCGRILVALFCTFSKASMSFLSASLYFSKRGAYYGRPLSVSGRPCYILPMFFIYLFIYFFNGRLILRPCWTEVRESFTRGGPWVSLKKLLLGFFLVILKLQSGPKSDEIWRIFRPHPQTFCSHARTWQNIVNSETKNLLSTDGCSTRNATFGKLWTTNPWDPRATKFLKNGTRE